MPADTDRLRQYLLRRKSDSTDRVRTQRSNVGPVGVLGKRERRSRLATTLSVGAGGAIQSVSEDMVGARKNEDIAGRPTVSWR